MAELLLTQDVYNQDHAAHPAGPLVPANPDQPLTPMEALHSVAEDPTNAGVMEGLNTAAQDVARAKQALEGGVGRRNGRRSNELQNALRTLGDRAEAANPNAEQFDRIQGFLATLSVADKVQSAEHGEVPGRTANVLSRIGGSAVMQRVARHARTLSRVYRGAGVALGLAGAAATIATGGTAAVAGVAAGAALRTARGAVTGAAVAAGMEGVARQRRNTSEAIGNRNSEQERARNEFMIRNIKTIIGRPEDAPLASDELAAHVNSMIPEQYQRLRDSLINHVVETSRGVRGQNNQMLRQAMGRGVRRGAVGGFAAGGIEDLAHNVVPAVEHAFGSHDVVSGHATGPTAPTPEQINSALQTAQEHSTGLMDHASANYPDQGTLWATVQDHGAAVGGHEHLTDAATENQILTGYGNMHAHGFGVNTSGLTLDQATNSYTPNSNDWWASVDAPKDGAWIVNGNTTDYIPGGAHLDNSQMAAIMDATQHGGAHIESAQEFHDNLVSQLTQKDALQQGIDNASAHAVVTPGVGELTANTVVDDLDAPTRWIEDMAAGALVPSLEGAYLVNRAEVQVGEDTVARNAAYDTERDEARAIIDGITTTIPIPAGASPAEQAAIVDMRLNAFAEAAFAHDSQVARYLANARARGLTQENQAEEALLTSLGIAGVTPAELRIYLGENFNYRRDLQEMSIDLAAAAVAAAAGGNVDANGNPIDASGNPIIARLGSEGNPAGAELLPLAVASPEAQARFNAFIAAMPNAISAVLNVNDPIRQRMLLNTLRINGLDVAGMREGVARHDADNFADRLGLRTGGILPLESDPERSADRIEDLYSTEYLASPRARLLLEVGVRTPDLLTRAANIINIDGIDAGNLPQTLAYQRTMQRLNSDVVGAAGNVDINGTGPEASDRLDNLMGHIPPVASEALNSDDALREELMRRALSIDNLDVPRLREEIANRDTARIVTDFEAHTGGPLGDTRGDPAERERRLADLYDNILVNNPRRRMLLEMDGSAPGVLAPVMNALHITDLAGGGLSAEEELNRDLSVRDLTHDLAPGAPRRPANWVGNQLSPTDADFAPTVTDRLQDLISMASPRERAAIERWQSGESIIRMIDVNTDTTTTGAFDTTDAAQWTTLWTDLQNTYNSMTGTPVTINRWEDAISNLPPRP